jgi:hypothetical protein
MRIRKPSSKLAVKNHHKPAVNNKFGKKKNLAQLNLFIM